MRIAVAFGLVGVVSFAMPTISAWLGLCDYPLAPAAVPFGAFSIALAVAAFLRGGRSWVEWVPVSLLTCGIASLALPLSAPPTDLGWLLSAMRVQTILVGVAGCGAIAAAVLALRAPVRFGLHFIQALACALVGVVLLRLPLRALLPISTYAEGFAEMDFLRMALASCAGVLFAATVAGKVARPSSG